jgi:hypothetical protein
MFRNSHRHGLLVAAMLLILLSLTVSTAAPPIQAQGNQGNPGILPPNSHPFGLKHTIILTLALAGAGRLTLPGHSSDRPPDHLSANSQAICPGNIEVNTENQLDSTVAVSYSTPVGLTCVPASGSRFPAGTTTVTCFPTRSGPACDLLAGCCQFRVTVYNVCLRQDPVSSLRQTVRFLRFSNGPDLSKRPYQYTDCAGAGPFPSTPFTFNGTALITRPTPPPRIMLTDSYRLGAFVNLSGGAVASMPLSGRAWLRTSAAGATITVLDSNMKDSRCVCSSPGPTP